MKRSVTIQGHRTSFTLEPVFWEALRAVAAEQGRPLSALVAEIDEARTTNLSSAIRVWLFARVNKHPLPLGERRETAPLGRPG